MPNPTSPDPRGRTLVAFDTLLTLALQEQTRRDLDALPGPDELARLYPDTARWDKRLRRALRDRRRARPPAGPRRMTLRRLALVMAVLVLLMTCALATSAEVRYAVRQAVLQWTNRELRLTYATEGAPDPAALTLPEGFSDHYVPEGFVMDEENSFTTQVDFFHKYYAVQDTEKNYSVSCYVIQQNAQIETFDNEHTVYESISINGIEATLGTSTNYDGKISYYLFWNNGLIHCTVHGNLSLDTILEIAEGIAQI